MTIASARQGEINRGGRIAVASAPCVIHRTYPTAKDTLPPSRHVQTISPQQAEKLIDALSDITSRASAAILAIPLAQAEQRTKADQSPVTAADEAAEAVILEGLGDLCPGVPVVAEESVARGHLPDLNGGSFFLVDPLDGTKEFIAGRDEYTVNIALISGGVPIAGVIAAPKQGLLWRGVTFGGTERLRLVFPAQAAKAEKQQRIHVRPAPAQLKVATSRSHLDDATQALMARLPVGERYMCGSSVKFCHLAEGSADIYPRLSPTCEWDIAAGIAILTAAGGAAVAPDGGVLRFGNRDKQFRVPGFIAAGDPASLPRRT
ncbi:MAG: 3'(2'),5'-bisphosphate nucleotidase CysQ [Pseudolabrys sp.]|nr:3'(2'),5'-bisphosphate nucleotidase CysQ [Pseudolabrys sp.]